jgi:hypothetical protein
MTSILNMIMTQEQIDHIVNNSDWNEEKKEWTVPYFTYKERNMGLPKLNSTGMSKKDAIDNDKDKKEIVFKNTHKGPTDREKNNDGFKVNHILKNAREGSETLIHSNQVSKAMSNVNRAQLTPLKVDAYDRAKGDMVIESNEKKRKM